MDDINPFQTLHVNYMLNSVGYPVQKMQRVGTAIPRFTGHSVTLGEDSFSALRKITDGGFATIFTAKLEDKLKVLKVKLDLFWGVEFAVSDFHVSHCRFRLLQWSGRLLSWRSCTHDCGPAAPLFS